MPSRAAASRRPVSSARGCPRTRPSPRFEASSSFRNANLDDIKGIGGILSSVGQYRGTLEHIEVDGQTETPDFSIDIAIKQVPLFTRFKAIVDGTNGDTWLDRVDARLGRSNILASGAVVRERDVKGRHVALDIQIRDARIEDILQLAVESREGTDDRPHGADDDVPAAGGRAGCHRSIESEWTIPSCASALQQHRRAAANRGARACARAARRMREPTDTGPSVVSNMRGRFVMHGAKIDFKELTFTIPGAEVQLAGLYQIYRPGIAGLHGRPARGREPRGHDERLQVFPSPVSHSPSLNVKAEGSTGCPIKISGPRSKPEFGLDMSRVFRRGGKTKSG